jgi:hypothetical protein
MQIKKGLKVENELRQYKFHQQNILPVFGNTLVFQLQMSEKGSL